MLRTILVALCVSGIAVNANNNEVMSTTCQVVWKERTPCYLSIATNGDQSVANRLLWNREAGYGSIRAPPMNDECFHKSVNSEYIIVKRSGVYDLSFQFIPAGGTTVWGSIDVNGTDFVALNANAEPSYTMAYSSSIIELQEGSTISVHIDHGTLWLSSDAAYLAANHAKHHILKIIELR